MAQVPTLEFCSSFDRAVAFEGPEALFIRDREGLWRLAPNWTRNAHEALEGDRAKNVGGEWRWLLARDHDTGFVQLLLSTGQDLLHAHPRMDLQCFAGLEEAEAARRSVGDPPVCKEAW